VVRHPLVARIISAYDLSFPHEDGPMEGERLFLGDMALAWETLAREAAEMGKSDRDHATHLVVHGMLHLMGMDHEDDAEAAEMEALEAAILARRFGIENPYEEETA
jgi:probable rRNA maturation factor